jgi:PiT family inorganic phosphate transporter
MAAADLDLVAAIALIAVFAMSSGAHDAADAIATLVATRAAHPIRAMGLAAVCGVIGPLVWGRGVASSIAKVVTVSDSRMTSVIGAGVTGALAWNLFTRWRALPSSSSHALIGGLIGAAVLDSGTGALVWGPWHEGEITGVLAILIGMGLAVILGFGLAAMLERLAIRAMQRATVRMVPVVRGGQWVSSGWLSLSQSSNDVMKSVGVIAAVLAADGRIARTEALSRGWILAISIAMTAGAIIGGWTIVTTIGKRIFPLRSIDGLVSQTASAAIIFSASATGAPISTTQVVASSIVGIGAGRSRFRHIGWAIVRNIGIAWLTTIPIAAALGALALPLWRLI